MKKIISLSLTLLLAVGLFSACGCAKKEHTDNITEPEASSDTAAITDSVESDSPDNDYTSQTDSEDSTENFNADLPDVSDNKEVVNDENAPKVFMIQDAESNADKLTYHLEDCKKLEGKEVVEVSWEYIKTVGFWQCPDCNPPRYENYTNAQ